MAKAWLGNDLKRVIKKDRIGQYSLSSVLDKISKEYGILPQMGNTLDMIIRDVYLLQSKNWNRFIHLYTLSTQIEDWPDTIPANTNSSEYIDFLHNKIDTGMENGSLVTFVAPMKENNGMVLFQILGRHYYASGSSVVDRPRNERKVFKKVEDIAIKAFLKRGSLHKIQDEELGMVEYIIEKHIDLEGINPINIFKVDEEAFERVEKIPFDLTI